MPKILASYSPGIRAVTIGINTTTWAINASTSVIFTAMYEDNGDPYSGPATLSYSNLSGPVECTFVDGQAIIEITRPNNTTTSTITVIIGRSSNTFTGEVYLADWTDDMIYTLPGWTGWQYSIRNVWTYWAEADVAGMDAFNEVMVQAGECCLFWDTNRVGVIASSTMSLIANRPYVHIGSYYYIRGDYQFYSSGNPPYTISGSAYSIGRVNSIPE